jgi:curved DNA-binding protein CbpA
LDIVEILDVSSFSSSKTIRKAYRALSLKHHPDKGGELRNFERVRQAYEALTDPVSKGNYARYGHPDGPQDLVVTFPVPAWLMENQSFVLAAYLLSFIFGVPGLAYWLLVGRTGAGSPSGRGVMDQESKRHIIGLMGEDSNADDIAEALTSCPAVLAALTTTLKEVADAATKAGSPRPTPTAMLAVTCRAFAAASSGSGKGNGLTGGGKGGGKEGKPTTAGGAKKRTKGTKAAGETDETKEVGSAVTNEGPVAAGNDVVGDDPERDAECVVDLARALLDVHLKRHDGALGVLPQPSNGNAAGAPTINAAAENALRTTVLPAFVQSLSPGLAFATNVACMHSRFTLGEAIRLSGMISLGTKDVAETTMRNKALAALVAQGTKRRSLPDAASIVNTFTPTITSCKIEVLDEEEIATGKRTRKLGSDWSVKDVNTCISVCAYAVV